MFTEFIYTICLLVLSSIVIGYISILWTGKPNSISEKQQVPGWGDFLLFGTGDQK